MAFIFFIVLFCIITSSLSYIYYCGDDEKKYITTPNYTTNVKNDIYDIYMNDILYAKLDLNNTVNIIYYDKSSENIKLLNNKNKNLPLIIFFGDNYKIFQHLNFKKIYEGNNGNKRLYTLNKTSNEWDIYVQNCGINDITHNNDDFILPYITTIIIDNVLKY